MYVDIRPNYRHGNQCKWRRGRVQRLDEYSGQIEVFYKFKQRKYLLWVHLDNKEEVDRAGQYTQCRGDDKSVTTVIVHGDALD